MSLRQNWIYCRLSRDDLRAPGTTAEKLSGQEASCRRLADLHGLEVHHVAIERESGATLAGRPELLKLLHLARRGEIGAILCTFEDRLSRLDGRDRVDFEEALTDGAVTVISTAGATRYHHDEEPFARRVLAEAAAYELRAYGRRKKERNAQKLQENKRTGGGAPYGWRKDAHAPGGYAIIPDRYSILTRVLRHILDGGSAHSICDALNSEAISPPGQVYTGVGTCWTPTTIRTISLNPFNAGRHAQRARAARRGGRKIVQPLHPDDYVIAPTEGEWTHPLTWEEYLKIRASYSGRRRPDPPFGLLTGIMFCEDGGRMIRADEFRYTCYCDRRGLKKRTIMRALAEGTVLAAIKEAVDRFPSGALEMRGSSTPRSEILSKHARAQKIMREAFDARDELVRRSAFFLGLMDEAAYAESLRRQTTAYEAAKAEADALAAMLQEPEPNTAQSLVDAVREIGIEAIWEAWGMKERRSFLKTFIARVDMVGMPRKKRRPPPIVTLAEWVLKLSKV